MNDNHLQRIAWQATQQLCGNLDPEIAMTDFFRYLQGVMPIHHIFLGKFLENPPELHIMSLTDERGTTRYARRYPLTPEQQELARRCSFFDPSLTRAQFIPDARHPWAGMYVCPYDEFAALPRYPLLCYRITDTREFYGGASFVFQPGAAVTQDMLEVLELLEAPLRVFINASFQYVELRKIRDSISKENRALRQRLAGLDGVPVIGASGGLKQLMEHVRQVAPLEVSVFIRGETGTGKELIARTVHRMSSRADGPFVAVNCGAIPPDLIDSELFGHAKGAFTGAVRDHKGKFEQADGGTLFLDEVAELPLNVQARLLRVLQERTIDRVGGGAPVPVNFRLIAATHRPLEDMVEQQTLREDLYYRLHVVSLTVPPLRERRQDIPALVNHFLEQTANRFGVGVPPVPDEEMEKLLHDAWPGNVRQLQNVVEESLALHRHGELRFRREDCRLTPAATFHTSEAGASSDAAQDFFPNNRAAMPSFHAMAKRYLEQALTLCNGKIYGRGGVAELAGLNYGTVKGKLNKYGIPYGRNTRHGS